MAFNWQTFRTRTLTAIVFVAVMAVGLFWNQWSFFILFSIVHWGAWIEYQKLVSRFNPDYAQINGFHRWGVIAAGWLLMLFFTNAELQIGGVRLNEVAWWLGLIFLFLFPLVQLFAGRAFFIKNISYSLAGLIYISLSLGLLVDMRNRWTEEGYNTLGLTLPLLTIFTLWINDTMAYIVGSLIGKTPLSKVSPKKTWEGTIGGGIIEGGVNSIFSHFIRRLTDGHTGFIADFAATSGNSGDLF